MRQRIKRNVTKNAEKIWLTFLLPALRERLFNDDLWGAPGSKQAFEFLKNYFKLSRIPFFRERIPAFDPKRSNMSWIPINKDIEGAEGVALPEEVLGRFIEKAKHRAIVRTCGCRKTMDCKDYPHDIGCLMMGESVLQIPEKMRRLVGVEEAKAHVRTAVEAGLIPITGKARIDNDLFLIPDEGKLLTVCFCCDCCCITRFSRYGTKDALEGMHHPVEGLSIEVTDACIGCGVCVSKCYLNAIELVGQKAEIRDLCRVCGRCAMHCPENAIKLKLDNPNAVQDVVHRIESVVDF